MGLDHIFLPHEITKFWTFGPTSEPWGQSIVDPEKPDERRRRPVDETASPETLRRNPWCFFFRICV